MSLMQILEQAQGGGLFRAVARSLDIDETQTRSAMARICPAIAGQLHARAAEDEDLFHALLELIEDGAQGSRLEEPEALTGSEAVSDGNAILDDLFGSRSAAMAALRRADPSLAERELSKLAPISATAVVAALAQANRPLGLASGSMAASSAGQGFFGALVSAVLSGIVSALSRQLRTPRRRRSTSYARTRSRKKSTARTRSTARRQSASVEDIFRDILGKIGK